MKKIRRERIFDQMRSHFDEFTIERKRFGVWFCSKRGSWMGSFYAVYIPGTFIITGDMAELTLRPSHPYTLAWLRGCKPANPDYPLSKIPHWRDTSVKCYDEDLAHRYVADELKDALRDEGFASLKEAESEAVILGRELPTSITRAQKLAEDFKTALSIDDGAHDWWRIWQDCGYDEPPDCTDWASSILVGYHGACWFASHLDPEDPRFAEEMRA
jgi:hypothetical protein